MSIRSHRHIRFKTEKGDVDDQIKRFRSRMFLIHVEEAKEWMERMIGEMISIPTDGNTDFLDVLRTSEHLAMLGNRFRKKKLKVYRNINPKDRMAFRKSMDNFQNFQTACIECGFPKFSLCTFEDLYKRKNVTNVIQTIHAFANHLVRNKFIGEEDGMKDFEEKKDDFEFSEQAIKKIEEDFQKIEEGKGKLNLDFSSHKKKKKKPTGPAPLPPMNPSLVFYSGPPYGIRGEDNTFKITLPIPNNQEFDVNFKCRLFNKKTNETIVLNDVFKGGNNNNGPNQTSYLINYNIPTHGDFQVLTTINDKYEIAPWDLKVLPHEIDVRSIDFSKPYDMNETSETPREFEWDHLERDKEYGFRLKLKDLEGKDWNLPMNSRSLPFRVNLRNLENNENFEHLTDIKFFGNGEFEVRFRCPFDGNFHLDVDVVSGDENERDTIFRQLCVCESTRKEVEERVFLDFLPEAEEAEDSKNKITSQNDESDLLDELNSLGFGDDDDDDKKKPLRRVECIVKLRDRISGNQDMDFLEFFFSFDIKSDDDGDEERLKTHKIHHKFFEGMFQRFVFEKFQEKLIKRSKLQKLTLGSSRQKQQQQDLLKTILDDDRIMEEFGDRLMRQKFCRKDVYVNHDDTRKLLRIENFRFRRWKDEEAERRKEAEELERQRTLDEFRRMMELEEEKKRQKEKERQEELENWEYLRQLSERKRKLEEEEELRRKLEEKEKEEERERIRKLEEDEFRRQEELRRRQLLLEEQRRRILEEQKRREAQEPFPIPRVPPWTMNLHPNQKGPHRKLYNLNFWVQLFLKVEKMKKKLQPKKIDGDEGNISQINSKDISLTMHKTPDIYNCGRKRDILSFGDLLLQTSQNYLFSLIREISERAPGMKEKAVTISKGMFTILKEIYETFRFVLEKTPFLKESPMAYSPIMVEQSKGKLVDIISSAITEYVKTIFSVCQTLSTIIHPSLIQNMKFLTNDIKNVNVTFRSLIYQMLSTTGSRKILVSEIALLNPPRDDGSSTFTKSHSVNIPLNFHFDDVQFSKNQTFGIATTDKNTVGLRNVWKSAYVRNYVDVKFECIRSNVVSQIHEEGSLLPTANSTFRLTSLPKVAPGSSKMEVMMSNTRALLVLIACNHVKRFTRQELSAATGFTHRTPLEIPTIFLSLLTPFYFRNEIQNALIHQKLIVSCLSSVRQVTCDLHDGKGRITVPVKYSGTPIMLNFGVGVVIKTLQMGIGFQRMLNNRRCGIRPFEIEVINYLWTMRVKRNQIRNQVFDFLKQYLFNSTREGKILESSLLQRKEKIDNVNFLLNRYDSERIEKCKSDDAQMMTFQTKLDELIAEHLEKNLNSVTKLEYYFRLGGIKSLVDKIMKLHKKIYEEVEKKYDDLWHEEIHWEGMLVKELNSIIFGNKFPHLSQNPNLQNLYLEYQDISIKMIDMTHLFMDFRTLYFERRHESFSLNPLKKSTKEVMVHDPYDLPVRLLLLGFGLGYQLHLSSRTGGERCNEAIDQMLEYTEMRYMFGKYPSILRDSQKFNNWRKKIHSCMSINGGSFEINKLNNGLPGADRDASVAGRFRKLEEFQKYNGLYQILKDSMEIKKGRKAQDAFSKFKKLKGRRN